MRRSVYQRTFLEGSSLYRGSERRQSTLPPHVRVPVTTYREYLEVRKELRPSPLRFSCSEAIHSPERPSPRLCRSADEDLSDFPIRIKTDLSSETFKQSNDSDSTGSFVSPRSHRSTSNHGEEIELDVFSRQSSEASEELRARRKPHRSRFLSHQDSKKKESTESGEMCTPERQASDSGDEPKLSTGMQSLDETNVKKLSLEVTPETEAEDSENTQSHNRGLEHGEGYAFALKQFESFDLLCSSQKNSDDDSDNSPSNKGNFEILELGQMPWKKNYLEESDSRYTSQREEGKISFKFDVLTEPDPGSISEFSEQLLLAQSLFPRKSKPTLDEAAGGEITEKEARSNEQSDEGIEVSDLFTSQLEARRREAFRKERSLDSDETSGFVSKHSSETTDLSSRLSTQFTTKHLSEPLGFGTSAGTSDMSQHLSEPNDFGSRMYLSVDIEPGPSLGISKKREHFRKSKRLKHFNLRRIDDTDNDSSCDSERQQAAVEEPPEPPSTRLKEEVGLPKHLSRDSSVDRYGVYRSEKTIASFDSDRTTQARLQDFESFCEAVNFPKRLPVTRQKAASADDTDPSDSEQPQRARGRRKARNRRDLPQRLKCLLL